METNNKGKDITFNIVIPIGIFLLGLNSIIIFITNLENWNYVIYILSLIMIIIGILIKLEIIED